MMSSPWFTSCCREVGRLKAYCLPKLGKLTASREEPGMLAVLVSTAMMRQCRDEYDQIVD